MLGRMRKFFVLVALIAFVALGLDDLLHGGYKTGVASMCLAAANALLLL